MRIEPGAALKYFHEYLLREIRRVILVLQAANEKVKELFRVSRHQFMKRCVVARRESPHVFHVQPVRVRRIHVDG